MSPSPPWLWFLTLFLLFTEFILWPLQQVWAINCLSNSSSDFLFYSFFNEWSWVLDSHNFSSFHPSPILSYERKFPWNAMGNSISIWILCDNVPYLQSYRYRNRVFPIKFLYLHWFLQILFFPPSCPSSDGLGLFSMLCKWKRKIYTSNFCWYRDKILKY